MTVYRRFGSEKHTLRKTCMILMLSAF